MYIDPRNVFDMQTFRDAPPKIYERRSGWSNACFVGQFLPLFLAQHVNIL